VAEVLRALETLQPPPQSVRMTGSGACCFALYASLEEAARAAVTLRKDAPDWWIRAVTITQ
jgi:4-diphosphocytidyl-2-C-methyl-D-erythritol kinase